MVLRMSEETELTFKQLRELALAHHIATSRRRDKKITGFTPFTSR